MNLLKTGQCARIRGENSDSAGIRVWYDPKSKKFLIPSNDYFDHMKKIVPKVDLNKKDFEVMLADAGILSPDQRKEQLRRTFEVVVQKENGKRSVLKINADALSAQFSESAQEYLDQMSNDKSPYRARKL